MQLHFGRNYGRAAGRDGTVFFDRVDMWCNGFVLGLPEGFPWQRRKMCRIKYNHPWTEHLDGVAHCHSFHRHPSRKNTIIPMTRMGIYIYYNHRKPLSEPLPTKALTFLHRMDASGTTFTRLGGVLLLDGAYVCRLSVRPRFFVVGRRAL